MAQLATLYVGQVDHDNERAGTTVNWETITEVNFVSAIANMNILQARIDALTLGTLAERSITLRARLSNTPPNNPLAQRETKWLVSYEDITEYLAVDVVNPGFGKIFTLELPCADLSLLSPNSDEIDYTNSAYTNFRTTFENHAKSPYGGAVRILKMRHVGRNI